MRRLGLVAMICAASAAASAADLATAFGARETGWGPRLSPNGSYVSFIAPIKGRDTALYVAPTDGSAAAKPILYGGTDGHQLRRCEWASEMDLWCSYTRERRDIFSYGFTTRQKLAAVKRDGTGIRPLGRALSGRALGQASGDGYVMMTPADEPGTILMQSYLPEETTEGTLAARRVGGWAVEKVNIGTGKRTIVERPNPKATGYWIDMTGAVRFMSASLTPSDMVDNGDRAYFVRPRGSKDWKQIARDHLGEDFQPQGFDESGDWLFVRERKNGKYLLTKHAADGSGRQELVFEHPRVDVDGLDTLGGKNRPVGIAWSDTYSHVEYTDKELDALHTRIGKTLKGSPTVGFLNETADGRKLLVFAGSDRDPGRYYILDREQKKMVELMAVREGIDATKLGEMKPVSYPARDGAQIPGYLTMPAGAAKNLPVIVMPHGGPSARDVWGFDWLVQFYAAQGYAVLQPNFRGSTGFGEAFENENAIINWAQAMNDINDGARWLVKEGIADPARVAIVGWSYGGYAALQANVVDPSIYKAAIAIAPVTDLIKVRRQEGFEYASSKVDQAQFGRSTDNLAKGSPARNAAAIRAPVLMFHGERDANVLVDQARDMEAALKAAGKPVELVVYPVLAHSLDDSAARTDMLRKSAAFLERNLGKPGGALVVGGTN